MTPLWFGFSGFFFVWPYFFVRSRPNEDEMKTLSARGQR